MKTLSIKQPYATLIAEGIKNIENRSFKTNFRGTFLIHASAQWHDRIKPKSETPLFTDEQMVKISDHVHQKSENGLISKQGVWRYLVPTHGLGTLPVSAIIGQVDLVDCVINHNSVWAEYTSGFEENGKFVPNHKPIYNWVLENAIIYPEPILNIKGKLSFWEFDIKKCHCCGKTIGQTEIFQCEICENDMCSDCQAPYNQFSQIDFNCCTYCYNE